MQFIYYMEFWGQLVVVIVTALVNVFQKILILDIILFPILKVIAFNYNIIKFRLRCPYQGYIFSDRTPRAISETTKLIENICCQSLKKMFEYQAVIGRNGPSPEMQPKLICKMYSLYVVILRSKVKISRVCYILYEIASKFWKFEILDITDQ